MEGIEDKQSSPSSSALIFLGTGCSSAVPYAMCLLRPLHPPCTVCLQSLSLPPQLNPNYRCNTSLLIDYRRTNDEHKYILIDVGKTFREQVLRWFTHYKIPRVDSIVLTHEHADAVLGLDDLHDILPSNLTDSVNPSPIYLSQSTMLSIAVKLPHLLETPLKEGQLAGDVAQLDWRTIESDCEKPFIASGLQFVPLPVMHGEDYISLGFLFGEACKVAYVSDVSRFPPTTEHVISKNGAGQVDLLILDANTPVEVSGSYVAYQLSAITKLSSTTAFKLLTIASSIYACIYGCMMPFFIEPSLIFWMINIHGYCIYKMIPIELLFTCICFPFLLWLLLFCLTKMQITSRSTHFCLSQTLEAIKRIRPKKALLIGMNHDFDHHSHNLYLEEWSKREGILVQLAHDGLRIPIQL